MLNIGSRWASGFRPGPILLAHIENGTCCNAALKSSGGLNLVSE